MTGCPGVVVVEECDEEGCRPGRGRLLRTIEIQNLLRVGTRHVTDCLSVVVVQECDEEGVDAAGGAYCER